MSKMSKAIAVLGVVAGLGVAALPLSSYAALPPDGYKTATSAQVQVEVEGAVSIATNVNSGEAGDGIGKNGIIDLGKIMPGATTPDMTTPLEVIVSSNSDGAQFDLYINTLEADGALTGINTGTKINGGTPGAATQAWGYAMGTGDDGTTYGTYEAVPTAATKVNTAKLVTSGASTNASKKAESKSNFKFQASTLSTTTADIYRGTVVFTAVVE